MIFAYSAMIATGSLAPTTKMSTGRDGRPLIGFNNPRSPVRSKEETGSVHIHRPAGGSHEERDRHFRAVRSQLVSALPARHPV